MSSSLIEELRGIVGAAHVLSGDQDRTAYDQGVLPQYQGLSLAVVRPGSTAEVAEVVRVAAHHGAAIIPQGGNTGVTGATTPDQSSIILSLVRMNRIEGIDTATRTATVEAGVVLEQLHQAAEAEGLVFPLFFGARGSAMVGGAISTNAGGSNALRYGSTRALVLGIEVVTADGRVMNLMSRVAKDNTGYDLKDLFIGAEGTLGVVTRAVVRLFPRPRAYATALLAMDDLSAALDLLHDLQDMTGNAVEGYEFMPPEFFEGYALLHPDRLSPLSHPGAVNILLEIGATSDLLTNPDVSGRAAVHGILETHLAKALEAGQIHDAVIAQNDAQRAAMWHLRESANEQSLMRGPGIDHDIALPLDTVATFLDRMETRLPEIAPDTRVSMVAHLGDGNLHYTVIPKDNAQGVDPALRETVTTTVEELVAELGGSFSAEHGIGLSKRATMARRKDPVALDMMRALKAALDPDNRMNPGKLLP